MSKTKIPGIAFKRRAAPRSSLSRAPRALRELAEQQRSTGQQERQSSYDEEEERPISYLEWAGEEDDDPEYFNRKYGEEIPPAPLAPFSLPRNVRNMPKSKTPIQLAPVTEVAEIPVAADALQAPVAAAPVAAAPVAEPFADAPVTADEAAAAAAYGGRRRRTNKKSKTNKKRKTNKKSNLILYCFLILVIQN